MICADGWTNPWIWAYLGVWMATSFYALMSLDEDLARERFSPPEPGADRLSLGFIRLIALAHLIIGALDIGRWHLLPAVPSVVRGPALLAMAISFALVFRAMHENRFFSSVVRIQRDRGHHLIDSGPYAIVRHPGYAGMLVAMPLSALALGSWVSLAIALVYSGFILRRVVFEDGFLKQSLDGYSSYANRVRYRLIPGVW